MSFQQVGQSLVAPQQPTNPTHGHGLPDNMVMPERFIDNILPQQIKSFGNREKHLPLYNRRIVHRVDVFMPKNFNLGTNDFEYQPFKPVYKVPLNQGYKFI